MASRGKKKQIKGEALDKINAPVFKDEEERRSFWLDYIASLYLVKLNGVGVYDIDDDKISDFWTVWYYGCDFLTAYASSENLQDFKNKICEYIDKIYDDSPSIKGGD